MDSLTILDNDYSNWIENLTHRYRNSQIRAARSVNKEMLTFYWLLGRDIIELQAEARWGSKFFKNLSADLKHRLPDATCFSQTNLLYMKNFYRLYSGLTSIAPQVVEQNLDCKEITPQLVEQFEPAIFSIPWGHHRYLIDKFLDKPEIALFYVRETVKNGWSRDVMLNMLETGLHNRAGKAVTNFAMTLPEATSDLATELTRDPYNFAFTGITGEYNERILKDALLANITQFLIELGTGFAYVGKEYRLKVGAKEKFIDLLFYNLQLSCYVVVEVKIGDFDFTDMGQLSGYVVACNHILKKEGRDNPTIGLLICKQKDNLMAQYALEGTNLPVGISEFELAKLYPDKIDGTMPTIEEIEKKLK